MIGHEARPLLQHQSCRSSHNWSSHAGSTQAEIFYRIAWSRTGLEIRIWNPRLWKLRREHTVARHKRNDVIARGNQVRLDDVIESCGSLGAVTGYLIIEAIRCSVGFRGSHGDYVRIVARR